jgi:amidohydrolase
LNSENINSGKYFKAIKKMVDILKEAQSLFEFSRDLRREFHRHPETGFQETATARLVINELEKLNLDINTGIAKTGIVALLDSHKPGPVVMLRADMDALPVTEETGASYASLSPGIMHACGHDGHMAVLLTVARLLDQHRDELQGTVKFIFQPAEEGLGGASAMVKAGILENPAPDYVLAMHLWNEQPLGKIVVSPGAMMAGSETFTITITGRGGHGALPNQTIDPVVAAAVIVNALQTIVSRNVSPLQTAVISVTKIQAGTAYNIIPPVAELMGTIRTFDPEVRSLVLDRFQQIIEGIADAMSVNADVQINHDTSPVINDQTVCSIVSDIINEITPGMTIIPNYQTMVSEDVAFYLEKVPGCFLLVGSAITGRDQNYSHHHPKFDFDEQVMPLSAAILTAATIRLLNQHI